MKTNDNVYSNSPAIMIHIDRLTLLRITSIVETFEISMQLRMWFQRVSTISIHPILCHANSLHFITKKTHQPFETNNKIMRVTKFDRCCESVHSHLFYCCVNRQNIFCAFHLLRNCVRLALSFWKAKKKNNSKLIHKCRLK